MSRKGTSIDSFSLQACYMDLAEKLVTSLEMLEMVLSAFVLYMGNTVLTNAIMVNVAYLLAVVCLVSITKFLTSPKTRSTGMAA